MTFMILIRFSDHGACMVSRMVTVLLRADWLLSWQWSRELKSHVVFLPSNRLPLPCSETGSGRDESNSPISFLPLGSTHMQVMIVFEKAGAMKREMLFGRLKHL